ncbi:MAG: PAS domain S-box protein [Actinobacteria bacterium]|nr:PAS domain S-box protein [Actinomycetota bacterium]
MQIPRVPGYAGSAPWTMLFLTMQQIRPMTDSEEHYRAIVENASDLISTVDLDDRLTSVNAAFERVLGASRDDLLGRPLAELVAPEYHHLLQDALVRKLDGSSDRTRYDIEFVAANGTRVPVEVSSWIIREHGVPVGVQAICRDVRERHAAEQAIRDADRRHRELVENLPLVTYEERWNGETLVTDFVSPQIADMLGFPPEAWLGTGLWEELIHPDDREAVVREADERAQRGEPFRHDYRLRAADGRIVWVHDMSIPICDAEGNLVRTRGFLLDITARHEVEEALRESEELFRAAFEDAATGLVIAGRDGGIRHANEALCALLGYTRAELCRLDIVTITHPDDRDEARAALAYGRNTTGEKRFVRKDGRTVWVQRSVSPVRARDGTPVVFVAQVTDITSRRRAEQALRASEERFRTLFETSPYGMNVVDGEGRIIEANAALADMLGYTRGELLRMRFVDFTHPEDAALQVELQRELMSGERASYEIETRCRHADGSTVSIHLTAFSLPNANGPPSVVIGVAADVTERKALEEQLRQSQRIEAIGQLAGGVAHDFNNILTAIRSYSDIVEAALPRDADDRILMSIDGIQHASERAAKLTQQLLAFGRRQVLAPASLDLNGIISEQAPLLGRLLGDDIEIRLSLDPDITAVTMDAGQLTQVLVNLAVNARDAMVGSPGLLTIRTENVMLEDALTSTGRLNGPHVLLAVGDTGVGMDAETLGHAFEPFFTTKEQGHGTGLGLSTVLGIVEQSGGRITAYSEPGIGTTFKVYLPSTSAGPAAAVLAVEEPEGRPGGTERILLVEDNDAVRAPLERLLDDLGYHVVAAGHPTEALELASREPDLDLLITDVVMPTMNGRELAEALLRGRDGLKVLYMSGYTDDRIIARGLIGPEAAFLQKPFGIEHLAQKIRELLDGER